MREVYVFCEGPTEQGFCKQVLAPHLFAEGEGCIHTIRIAHSKHHGIVSRGGIGKFASLKRDIRNTLKQRVGKGIYFTTLIDLYGLPKDFPGKEDHVRDPNDPTPYVLALEKSFAADVGDLRFVPYLQLHEFETLLCAEPDAFRIAFDHCESQIVDLRAIVNSFPSVEHINDGKQTAPSKRIIDLFPAYEGRKTSAGPDIAEVIGVARLREACPHFHHWLDRLENLDWGED